jgi:hypothetical protein
MGSRYAFVVAAIGDYATEYLSEAATYVKTSLEHHFDTLYRVSNDFDSVVSDLYELPYAQSDGASRRFEFGYVSAHGSDKGLKSPSGQGGFGLEMARLMRRAIVVFVACLKTGEYPQRLLEESAGVSAVIGYRKSFSIPTEEAKDMIFEDSASFQNFQLEMNRVVGATVMKMLTPGTTAHTACEETRRMWGVLGRDDRFSERARNIALTNGSRIATWPPSSKSVLMPHDNQV